MGGAVQLQGQPARRQFVTRLKDVSLHHADAGAAFLAAKNGCVPSGGGVREL